MSNIGNKTSLQINKNTRRKQCNCFPMFDGVTNHQWFSFSKQEPVNTYHSVKHLNDSTNKNSN